MKDEFQFIMPPRIVWKSRHYHAASTATVGLNCSIFVLQWENKSINQKRQRIRTRQQQIEPGNYPSGETIRLAIRFDIAQAKLVSALRKGREGETIFQKKTEPASQYFF